MREGDVPCRRQRSQPLLYDVRRAVRSSRLVGYEEIGAALGVHCGHRSGLAAGVGRLGQRRHSVVVHRASQSYQPLELLFWQQFSVSSDFDQGAEREAAMYVVTKAAVGLLV